MRDCVGTTVNDRDNRSKKNQGEEGEAEVSQMARVSCQRSETRIGEFKKN